MQSFGDAFREARTARKSTLREIAEHVGKSIGYLSDVELIPKSLYWGRLEKGTRKKAERLKLNLPLE